MENPQTENGYTKIANEILEVLSKSMPGFTEGQIIMCILRKTYGWNKKSDNISISQLVEMTGKSRRMIIYSIQNLEAKKMIKVFRSRKSSNESNTNNIAFNKNYSEWVVQEVAPGYKKELQRKRDKYNGVVQEVAPQKGSATIGKKVVQRLVNDVQIVAPTKETITKDNIQKKEYTSLKDIQEVDLQEIADQYQVPLSFVKSKYEDLILYCSSKGKKYRNYKLALMAWVKKDAMTIIKEQHDRSKIVYIP